MGKKKKGIEAERETNNGKINRELNRPPQETQRVGHTRGAARETFPLHCVTKKKGAIARLTFIHPFSKSMSRPEFRFSQLMCVVSWITLLAFYYSRGTAALMLGSWLISVFCPPVWRRQSFCKSHTLLQLQEKMLLLRSRSEV